MYLLLAKRNFLENKFSPCIYPLHTYIHCMHISIAYIYPLYIHCIHISIVHPLPAKPAIDRHVSIKQDLSSLSNRPDITSVARETFINIHHRAFRLEAFDLEFDLHLFLQAATVTYSTCSPIIICFCKQQLLLVKINFAVYSSQ